MQVPDRPAHDRLGAEIQLIIERDEETGSKGPERSAHARCEHDPVDQVQTPCDGAEDQQASAPAPAALELPRSLGLAEG
jgi:hypothetical protein